MIFFLFLLQAMPAWSKVNVITTVPDLRSLAAEVGGGEVVAESLGHGTQDPHFIEAKPSFMLKTSKADLVLSIGLDLEVGWLPSILQGARNPKVQRGGKGFLEVGPLLDPLEVPVGKVTRADGDVHPFGNPHVTLDPIRMGVAAVKIGEALSQIDAAHKADYTKNALAIQARLKEKTEKWKARIQASGVTKVVSYHKTLSYFLERFGLTQVEMLEPKPGIPPTSGHILDVIDTMKKEGVKLVLIENYFDATVTKKIKESIPGIRVAMIPVAVDGDNKVHNLDELYEELVKVIEAK